MKKKIKTSRRAGYSLLEITLALSIIAMLFLLGSSPGINPKKHQLGVAVRKVHSTLSVARFRSVQRQIPIRVSFSGPFLELAEYDSQKSEWFVKSRELLEGVEVDANNSPVFYPQGTVSNLATIRIKNEHGAYQITVAITGRIKIVRTD